MAGTSETGHAKNVANLEELVSSVSSMGSAYNPSKKSLQLNSLQALVVSSNKQLSEVNEALSTAETAVIARKVSFSKLGNLVSRIGNAVKATDTTEEIDNKVREVIRKITGKRATPKMSDDEKKALESDGETVKENSASQMSFDNRLNNFDMLIKLLTVIPEYIPNEADLKVDALVALHSDLKTKNTACIAAETALRNARIARNGIFYKANTGLVDIALDVKTYVKSVFGASSPQYKQISKLKFIPKKK